MIRHEESGFDSSKTSHDRSDVQMKWQENEDDQQQRVIEESSKSKVVTLNIRDIGNETSEDHSASGIDNYVPDMMTPASSSAINITSPESAMSKSIVENSGNESFSTAYDGQTPNTIKGDSDVNADDEASRSNVQFSDFYNSPIDGYVPDQENNLSASNGDGKAFDPDETIDDGEVDSKSEITDDKATVKDEKSEVSEKSKSMKRKRLGSRGPVITVEDGGKTSKMSRNDAEKEEEEEGIYREITVVKLGCNKCTEVYYSDGTYNKHLFERHRIRNVSRHPPTVLNKIWTRIHDEPLIGNFPHKCDVCEAKFIELPNLMKHKENCKPRTVEDEEERQSFLYRMVKDYEEEKTEKDTSKPSEETNIIEPTQTKRERRS